MLVVKCFSNKNTFIHLKRLGGGIHYKEKQPIGSLFLARRWWPTPLIPALKRQRQSDLCEYEARLVYRDSSRTARATWRNPDSEKKGEKKSFIFLLMAIWLVGLEIMHIVHFGERRACPVVIGTELLHVMEHLPIKFPIYLTLFCSVLYGNSKFQAQVSLCSVATCF